MRSTNICITTSIIGQLLVSYITIDNVTENMVLVFWNGQMNEKRKFAF